MTEPVTRPTLEGTESVTCGNPSCPDNERPLFQPNAEVERLTTWAKAEQEARYRAEDQRTDERSKNEVMRAALAAENQKLREALAAAVRVDACLWAFAGNEPHQEPDGCLTRLHAALASAAPLLEGEGA